MRVASAAVTSTRESEHKVDQQRRHHKSQLRETPDHKMPFVRAFAARIHRRFIRIYASNKRADSSENDESRAENKNISDTVKDSVATGGAAVIRGLVAVASLGGWKIRSAVNLEVAIDERY